ncbi:uncharacterized protein KGF55_003156 [Candida pseudojiufengensis]|uniref:uncharacterized protein n=1 Tax=Candida pseudojiufengensis TaxID=497109 RepID=UPI002224689D|nr:uncharacterized protein KGF55_003156 [Candida pseudojiufengensis]KAI5962081.1 hypothetical protein KGF55_003156 [Candida pseudojiufengensis]
MYFHNHITPSVDIFERASKTSDDSESSSDYCKDHPKDDQCEKPVSDNSLTIALSIVLPIVAILCVLGFFVYKNYRKNKKEEMDKDPDFYENGDGTALPDFNIKHYSKDDENPFHNRNSARYPMEQINKGYVNYNISERNNDNYSFNNFGNKSQDPYLDSFVLPYQHQTGSKLSLDEYGKNLGDSQGYRVSTSIRTRSNSATLDNLMKSNSNINSRNHSRTQSKSHSRNPSSQISPMKKVQGKQYTNIPNESDPDLQHAGAPDVSNVVEEDFGSDDSGIISPTGETSYGVTYENESDMAINKAIPQIVIHDQDDEDEKVNDNVNDTTEVHTSSDESPFDEDEKIHHTKDTTLDTVIKHDKNQQQQQQEQEQRSLGDDDEDFDFNNDSKQSKPISKSPRMSAFNLLKNDSDNEDEDEELDNLTPQQQEEIKRMKSVYKVYFDKDNNENGEASRSFEIDENYPLPQKINDQLAIDASYDKDNNENGEASRSFEIDENYPLPQKINDQLAIDASYDKRYSNTSSVYIDSEEAQQYQQYQQQQYQQQLQQQYYHQFNQQYQQEYGSPVDPQLYQYYQQEQYDYYQRQQQQRRPNRPLPPLQKLRHPADLRKSTLETYTDFTPHHKNQTVMSPPIGKQPFVPIENDGVWTSPINSPTLQSQASFQNQSPQLYQHSQQGDYFPHQQQPQQHQHTTVPSATQLARSSVVMLNPVTEITKTRKFKPAGSLPSNPNSNHLYNFGHSDLNGPENDLLPGNRKSDVRRMMNTNF